MLVRSDGVSYEIIDEDDCAYALQQEWPSPQEAQGARSGLEELIDRIKCELLASQWA